MKKDIGKVKEFGGRHNYKELTTAKWECDEDDAGTLTIAAGYLLKARGGIPRSDKRRLCLHADN